MRLYNIKQPYYGLAHEGLEGAIIFHLCSWVFPVSMLKLSGVKQRLGSYCMQICIYG